MSCTRAGRADAAEARERLMPFVARSCARSREMYASRRAVTTDIRTASRVYAAPCTELQAANGAGFLDWPDTLSL
jgi:hypothetical protein